MTTPTREEQYIQNQTYITEYNSTYNQLFGTISQVTGATTRTRTAATSARLTEQVAEQVAQRAEQATVQAEAGVRQITLLQTRVLAIIANGLALAMSAENTAWINYWSGKQDFIINQMREPVERASRLAVSARTNTNDLRIRVNIITGQSNGAARVNSMMESTHIEVAKFDKLYTEYEEACNILKIIPRPIPEHFECTLSTSVMINPVSLPKNKFSTYEQAYIEKWLLNKDTDPRTNARVNVTDFVSNDKLKNEIEEFREYLISVIADSITAKGMKLHYLSRKVKSKQTKRRKVKSKQYKNKQSKRRR